MTKPLWQNSQWEIYEDQLKEVFPYHPPRISRQTLKEAPESWYLALLRADYDPNKTYEAFLQLATYWDLKCDYDELRKLRDEAKEPAE